MNLLVKARICGNMNIKHCFPCWKWLQCEKNDKILFLHKILTLKTMEVTEITRVHDVKNAVLGIYYKLVCYKIILESKLLFLCACGICWRTFKAIFLRKFCKTISFWYTIVQCVCHFHQLQVWRSVKNHHGNTWCLSFSF